MYTLQIEPSIGIPDVIFRNAVSNVMMLCLRLPQLHENRLTPGFPDLYHSLPQLFNTTIACPHDLRTKTCCPSFYTCSHTKGYPSAYTNFYTNCSTCATMKVRPCPHNTKMPDYIDVTEEVTGPGSTNDVLDPECPWTILAICAHRCWTLSLAQAP